MQMKSEPGELRAWPCCHPGCNVSIGPVVSKIAMDWQVGYRSPECSKGVRAWEAEG